MVDVADAVTEIVAITPLAMIDASEPYRIHMYVPGVEKLQEMLFPDAAGPTAA